MKSADRVMLHARQPGLWEVVVWSQHMAFTVPFYQYDKPCVADVVQAVREEITRRMSVAAAQSKPRKQKARAARSPEPRDTALIRRIERQMEGV